MTDEEVKLDNCLSESDFINLLNDVHFDRIELGLKTTNIFEILGISRAEIRHSNFLGWLLDPNEGHGLREFVLKRVLRDLFMDERVSGLNSIDADILDYKNVEIRREWQNIDLLIILPEIVVCIENKVDSKEHSDQLNRYRKIIEEHYTEKKHKIFVYLTPEGDQPETDFENYIPYSYIRFADIINNLMEVNNDTLNSKTNNYISDYLTILKRTIMQNDILNELAIKLYKTHKTTLDFIFENKPEFEQEIREQLEKKINHSGWILGSKNKGYIRFLPKALKAIVPVYDYTNGWPNKEAFSFEIDFYWSNKKSMTIRTVITPGEKHVREILQDVISKVEGATKPWGEKWICHFLIKKPFVLEKLSEQSVEERQKVIDAIWPTITELVSKVEKAIIEDGRLTKLHE